MYQPDVLAAAHAIGAYVEAYELTAEKEHLKRATYWAETALPFLYHWHLPDRPGMQFASIPVFGTSFYTHSWFGVPCSMERISSRLLFTTLEPARRK